MRLRSQVLRRNLPRPFKVNTKFSKSEKEISEMKDSSDYVPELIKHEITKMMINDSLTYPTKNNLPTKVSKKKIGNMMNLLKKNLKLQSPFYKKKLKH